MNSSFPFYIIPAILAAIAVLMIGFGISNVLKARETVSWPTVQGAVVESAVQLRRAKNKYYEWRVCYSYTANDNSFTGTRACIGTGGVVAAQSVVEDLARKYPEGAPISVSYHWTNPKESVLFPGVRRVALRWLVFGFFLLAFSALSAMLVFCGANPLATIGAVQVLER